MLSTIDFDMALSGALERFWDLERYQRIMEEYDKVDVSSDLDFQRNYTYFYQLRGNSGWMQKYYGLFERKKQTGNAAFASIISELFELTGRIEASFSSKMLATLNPSKPIWDRKVCDVLHLELTGKTKEEQLRNAISLYETLENWYAAYLPTANARENIRRFDKLLPAYTWLSDTKKIDYLLWSINP